MELKPLSPELDELRNVIISSNLTTCFLVLNELISKPDKSLHYGKFRDEWIELYKNVYQIISKMKTRKSSRA